MRVKLTLVNSRGAKTILPPNYSRFVQGLIYQFMEKNISEIIHGTGFTDPTTKRSFKMFTFSRLIPSKGARLKDGQLILNGHLKLVIASPVSELLTSLATKILMAQKVQILDQTLIVKKVELEEQVRCEDKALVKTISPITVYSTLLSPEGRKKTYYYSPFEDEFNRLVIENLTKKYRAFTGKNLKPEGYVKPYKVSKKDLKIVTYKGTVIKGWDGVYELSLPPELFVMAMDAGLGAKNSQGFGCVELIKCQ